MRLQVAGESRSFTVKIPPGIRVVRNYASPSRGNRMVSAVGGMFCSRSTSQHPFFRREGDDLHVEVSVDLRTACLGGPVSVQTLDGPKTVSVSGGFSRASNFVSVGKVCPVEKGSLGNLIATLSVTIPEPDELSDELRAALEASSAPADPDSETA